MEAEVVESSLTVKVRGPATEISLLTVDHIKAVVDLATAGEGIATYKVALTFHEDFPNVGALKTSPVTVSVRQPEEE